MCPSVATLFIVTRINPPAQVVRDTFDDFVHYGPKTCETRVAACRARDRRRQLARFRNGGCRVGLVGGGKIIFALFDVRHHEYNHYCEIHRWRIHRPS